MSLLKLRYHLRRLQMRNFHPSCRLYKATNYPEELISIEHNEHGKLRTIYKLPCMIHAQWAFNAKFYLPIICVPLWVTEGLAYALDELSLDSLILANYFKIVFLAKCLLFNKLLSNLIGFIYVTEDKHLVISFINFRGRRIDEKFSKNELTLEGHKFKMLDKLYVNIHCLATGRKFRLNLKLSVMDEIVMTEFFGSLPESAF